MVNQQDEEMEEETEEPRDEEKAKYDEIEWVGYVQMRRVFSILYLEREVWDRVTQSKWTFYNSKHSLRSKHSCRGEEKLRARNETKKAELNEQLKDVINEWRKNRAKEEEELQKVKI